MPGAGDPKRPGRRGRRLDHVHGEGSCLNPFPRLTLQALLESHFPAEPDRIQNIKDFRAVFLGSDQGKRVLAMIVKETDWLKPRAASGPAGLDVPLLAAYNDGRKSMAEWIASVIDGSTDEPQQQVEDGGRDDDYDG